MSHQWGKPSEEANECYDVIYSQYFVKRFNTLKEAEEFAKDYDNAWKTLKDNFPDREFEKGNQFRVHAHYSEVLK